MKLDVDDVTELEEDKGIRGRMAIRWPIVCQIYPRVVEPFGKKEYAIDPSESFTYPTPEQIRDLYNQICTSLADKYKVTHQRTEPEKVFFDRLRKLTRLSVHHSLWIGNRCQDVFLPQVKRVNTELECGLVVEVDGSIHDTAAKRNKDLSKYQFLKSLRIGVIPIRNQYAASPEAHLFINEIRGYDRLDTRGVQRVWMRIYLSTIAAHASDKEFCDLFGLNQRILQHSKRDG